MNSPTNSVLSERQSRDTCGCTCTELCNLTSLNGESLLTALSTFTGETVTYLANLYGKGNVSPDVIPSYQSIQTSLPTMTLENFLSGVELKESWLSSTSVSSLTENPFTLTHFNNVENLLPGGFYIFRPLLDIAAAWVPILFLLLAFLWQSAVGFR